MDEDLLERDPQVGGGGGVLHNGGVPFTQSTPSATSIETTVPTDNPTTAILTGTAGTAHTAISANSATTSFSLAIASVTTDLGSLISGNTDVGAANSVISQTSFHSHTTSPPIYTSSPTSSNLDGLDNTLTASLAAGRASDHAAVDVSAHSTALPPGVIAAIVVPILVVIAAAIACFLLWRRRGKRRASTSPLIPVMKERPNHSVHRVPPTSRDGNEAATPILTSSTNNAYFTGLDTGSDDFAPDTFYGPRDAEGGAFVDPPPPYKAKGLATASTTPAQRYDNAGPPILALPIVREPSERGDSPPVSPISTPSLRNEAAQASSTRPSISRRGTERSFTSTSYSDTASLRSAQAARRSVGGAQMISSDPVTAQAIERLRGDPFNDPDSPVSSIAGDETRSLNRGASNSRAVSPISPMPRRFD